jgi:hypothetical protein
MKPVKYKWKKTQNSFKILPCNFHFVAVFILQHTSLRKSQLLQMTLQLILTAKNSFSYNLRQIKRGLLSSHGTGTKPGKHLKRHQS